MSHFNDHADYLAKRDFVIPPGEFTPAEVQLLTKFGRWMEALASGALDPATPSQEQFLRVARGEADPTSEFERVWLKVKKERAVAGEAARLFQTLREARARASLVEAEYLAARQAVLQAVREQLDAVDATFAGQIQSATDAAAEAEKEARAFVLQIERSVAATGVKAFFRSGNASWDTEKLMHFAKCHPEVLAFRKFGKPSVALRFDAAGPSAQAGGHMCEFDSSEGHPAAAGAGEGA